MSVSEDCLNAEELLAQLGENLVNNAHMAGRWHPPGKSAGMYPAGDEVNNKPSFHDIYPTCGELSAELGKSLGPPMPNPVYAFGKVAGPDVPGMTPEQNLTLRLS